MREFNVTGLCVPDKHYMVDISNKLLKIKEFIQKGSYFTINRGRQYGKTTTLNLLDICLIDGGYLPVFISFEGLGDESFVSPKSFCPTFLSLIKRALGFTNEVSGYVDSWENAGVDSFDKLSEHLGNMCRGKKIVLMIDEVDKTSSNQIFLHFLGMLREKYLLRERGKGYTFHSVILAGVNDVRNIKLSLMQKGFHQQQQGERIFNSPWNIAADFDVDMSFNPDEICTMLKEYEIDHKTGMNTDEISKELYTYTSGYPFLVSRICKYIDEKSNKDWTTGGVQNAVKAILSENNTLFDDIAKNIESNEGLYRLIYDILITGVSRSYEVSVPEINIGVMYGILKNGGTNGSSKVVVANRIFEIKLYNYFIAKDELSKSQKITRVLQNDIVIDGRFDMELCLRKFAEHYAETFGDKDIRFLEQNARQIVLTYLRPLINGQGFYHIESALLDQRRMDIVLDFNKEQFVLEIKLWYGEKKHEEAYKQLAGYLEAKRLSTGYLLTFDFRKNLNKEIKAEWVEFEGKKIFDVVV